MIRIKLSDIEHEIHEFLISDPSTVKELANKLNLSDDRAKYFCNQVLRKNKCNTRVELLVKEITRLKGIINEKPK